VLIIAIIFLAIVLLALLSRPRRSQRPADGGIVVVGGNSDPGLAITEAATTEATPTKATPGDDDFKPGGGDFGGAGASGSWGDSGGDGGY
jgi:uncharacterized membrane protein YgcG